MNVLDRNPRLATKLVIIGLPMVTLVAFLVGLIVNEGSLLQAIRYAPFLWSFVYWPLIPVFISIDKKRRESSV